MTAPRPLRMFFEAQLGYELWLPGAKRRTTCALASAVRQVRRMAGAGRAGPLRRARRIAFAPEVELRIARRLLPLAIAIAVVGVAGTNLRTGGETILFERLANGDVQAEALAGSASGTGAAKGVVTDAVGTGAPAGTQTVPAPQAGAAPDAQAPVDRTIPTQRGALPVGKGMWIWLADQTEGGDADAIVARAREVGLTHLYVRTASLSQGFYAGPFLDRLLPAAHAASIRVYAWDFPYLHNVDGDVARAVQAITYVTPDGHRVDGYAADIELRSMGVNISPQTGKHFGVALRRAVGPNYPLIACVPRPSPSLRQYPMADLVAAFDAIAPMVYWLGGDPIGQMEAAFRDLAVYGKPVLPVGQAYDGGDEGGPRGVPTREELIRFMQSGDRVGAAGVSWWSWQHADQEAWDAIKDAAEFRLPVGDPHGFTAGQVMAYQTLLTSLGFPTPIDGSWSDATAAAVTAYQRAARLPESGLIDDVTRQILLTPFAPPVQPQP
ncbi:MAG TPA: peptidoglycan-binding domain-containing protein [Acidimicrobiales bacterium]|nr:peptidoglycan-binding domain-containing protein [Acidimicrobiales bacterium]